MNWCKTGKPILCDHKRQGLSCWEWTSIHWYQSVVLR